MSLAVARTVSPPPIVVASPRAVDAIGTTLRCTYGQDLGLPSEFQRLIAELNDVERRSAPR